MLQDKDHRLRIISIIKLIQFHSSESQPLTVQYILDQLERQHGPLFKYDRRAIYRDIDALVSAGFPVKLEHKKNNQREVFWCD